MLNLPQFNTIGRWTFAHKPVSLYAVITKDNAYSIVKLQFIYVVSTVLIVWINLQYIETLNRNCIIFG